MSSCVSQSLELPELGVLSGCPCTPTLPGSQEMGGCLLLGAGVGKLRRGGHWEAVAEPWGVISAAGKVLFCCSALLLLWSSGDLG